MACWMPSSTSSPIVCIFEVTDRMAMPPSCSGRRHRRTPGASQTASPRGAGDSPTSFSGNSWRRYTGSAERGRSWPSRAEYEPCGVCTPVRPLSRAQSGRGAALMARPAAMSSAMARAVSCQPAACQVLKGPWAQPNPQRIARSRSRALSATPASWQAL
ncbi:Uncharacterised protein [Bordetella pertussis]|nr:Uncharacterised protein [Bordetella pertussis]